MTLVKQTRFLLIIFLSSLFMASLFYGGGNYIFTDTSSYSFTTNFLSDLGRLSSHSGNSNITSFIYFFIGMSALGFGAYHFIFLCANYFEPQFPRIYIIAKLLALFGIICTIGIIVTPADVKSLYLLHNTFAYWVFYTDLKILALFTWFFFRIKDYFVARILLISTILIGLYIFFLEYGPQPWMDYQALRLHATAQKLAVLVLVIAVWTMTASKKLSYDKIN
jgi:hypothetical protein